MINNKETSAKENNETAHHPAEGTSEETVKTEQTGETLHNEVVDPKAVEVLKAEVDDLKDRYLRAKADYDNYRRRAEREKADLLNYGLENFYRELLPVLDSFDKALSDKSQSTSESFVQGVEMVRKQLWNVLEKNGLSEIKALDTAFDPNLHQAIQRIETPDVVEDTVSQELVKGYTLNGRLLRATMVVVSVPKSPN